MSVILDDSELLEIQKKYEEAERKAKKKKPKDKTVDTAREAAGLKE